MAHFYTVSSVAFDPQRDYPLGTSGPTSSRRPAGSRSTSSRCTATASTPSELRATPETLRLQAEVAARGGPRRSSPTNLRRAAELAPLPDETILEIYTALRPRRSTAAELEAWAERLDELGRAADRGVRARGAAASTRERGLLAA